MYCILIWNVKNEEGESIKDLLQRFTTLTNQLMLLGRTFDYADLVHKILKSLTKRLATQSYYN